jgi:hypothetical protein
MTRQVIKRNRVLGQKIGFNPTKSGDVAIKYVPSEGLVSKQGMKDILNLKYPRLRVKHLLNFVNV